MSTVSIIKARQRAWAMRVGLVVDADGYCTCIDDNIFRGLSLNARGDFEHGDGSELGKNGARGKIQALHSSSALACNWFDYWRNMDLGGLSAAFEVSAQFSSVQLEQKFATGLGGIGPNLDVLLWSNGTPFAIESKFTEPYNLSPLKTHLKPKYLEGGRKLWADVGLSGCQTVAEMLRGERHGFKSLDVPQLLKHMLALARRFGSDFSLCCLWFEEQGTIAQKHREELEKFAFHIKNDNGKFLALTYQELFARLVTVVGQDHSEYLEYLSDRYIAR